MWNQISDFFHNGADWSTSVAVIATLLSLASSLVFQYLKKATKFEIGEIQFENLGLGEGDKSPQIDWMRDTKIEEAKKVLKEHERSAKLSKWSTHSLTFGQYVIGGILASSFIQSSLSKETVGLLGVLVLISSLIQQKFRPDLQYRNAMERSMLLRDLIRKAQDKVFASKQLPKDSVLKAVQEIREMVSQGLSKDDEMELNNIKSGNGSVST